MIPAAAAARKGPEGKYPLHYLVWHNRHRELEKEVRAGQVSAPSGTPRPGTPARRGEGARRVLSRLPGEFAAPLCSRRGACARCPAESGGCSPSPAPLRRGRAPHTCPGPARTGVGDTVLLLRRGRGASGRGRRLGLRAMWWENPPHSDTSPVSVRRWARPGAAGGQTSDQRTGCVTRPAPQPHPVPSALTASACLSLGCAEPCIPQTPEAAW